MAVRGSGATAVRVNLYRKARKDPAYLATKKVVIWCFAAREFTQSDGWKTRAPAVGACPSVRIGKSSHSLSQGNAAQVAQVAPQAGHHAAQTKGEQQRRQADGERDAQRADCQLHIIS